MIMFGVQSSQIKEIGHEAATNTLAIRFNGKGDQPGSLYHYAGVDAEAFQNFKSADSIGSYFGKNIKGNFAYTKVPEKKEEDK